jgi:O-antigen ligase
MLALTREEAGEQGARRLDAILLGLALCAAPVSIAVAEILLTGALAIRIITPPRRLRLYVPNLFWYWLAWAILEIASWLHSPDLRSGRGEIRHLLLCTALFFTVPALNHVKDRLAVWRGIIFTATISSLFLIGHFVLQLLYYRGKLDPVVYLRSGGLLHNWMVYGTVEILVFAGLLEFWHFYPEEHVWLLPVFAIHAAAILLSLTRMLWLCCLLLLALHLIWCRSKWIWALPAVPAILLLLAPAPVRSRVSESMDPDYYSNAERLQMLRVGWTMIRQHPIAGVGPGRIDKLYTTYLSPTDPVPAYHGHLHNNPVQLAAQFGLPTAGAALLFVVMLFRELLGRCKSSSGRAGQLLCRTSILGLTGFLVAGMFDYTYGHSVALILLSYVILPLATGNETPNRGRRSNIRAMTSCSKCEQLLCDYGMALIRFDQMRQAETGEREPLHSDCESIRSECAHLRRILILHLGRHELADAVGSAA